MSAQPLGAMIQTFLQDSPEIQVPEGKGTLLGHPAMLALGCMDPLETLCEAPTFWRRGVCHPHVSDKAPGFLPIL